MVRTSRNSAPRSVRGRGAQPTAPRSPQATQVFRLRRKLGWSQEVLGKRAGFTRPDLAVSQIECNRNKLSTHATLVKLAKGFELHLDDELLPYLRGRVSLDKVHALVVSRLAEVS